MNTRRIRVSHNIIKQLNDSYLISYKNISLDIPMSFVIKTNKQKFYDQKKQYPWINLYLDADFFKNNVRLAQLSKLKNYKKIFIYGKRSHGIHWDNVITRLYSRPQDLCFYCDEQLNTENKTKDHVIPVVIIKALGFMYLDDNTVPCCKECNSEKSSLHPAYFRVKANRLARPGNKWSRVYKVLNKILIDKKDPYE